jgi:dihydrofolate synthase/folylpolyglutamate synthase
MQKVAKDSWLNYLETLHPKPMQLGLERIQPLAEKLKLIHFPCPVITVTGTNGKGSCVATLEAIYLAMGYRVGSYTSPHLLEFNERIRINGQNIADSVLCDAFSTIEAHRNQCELTYFEFTTLAALKIFQSAALDVLILEVGLGGRLDAVNIVEPDVSVITTIALDHETWLGHTRAAIATEKAGIFRANKPAVCGDFEPPESLFTRAHSLNTRLYCINKDFKYHVLPNSNSWTWSSAQNCLNDLPTPQLEIQNMASALMAANLLINQLPVSDSAFKEGILKTSLRGRFQCLKINGIACIADVTHNPAAALWLARKLMANPCSGKTRAVVGMLADKNIQGTFTPLIPQIEEWHLASLDVFRGANKQLLAKTLWDIGVNQCYTWDSVEEALKQALIASSAKDRIILFGSFHTVAAALAFYEQQVNSRV